MRLDMLATLALSLLLSSARAADQPPGPAEARAWPRFRGPNGSGVGHAPNLPATWTEKDYNWKAKLPGTGHSSPVVWGDRLFVTCGDNKSAKRTVLCLKAADGSVVWQRDYDSQRHAMSPDNSYATSTPAVDQHRVYAYWTTPEEITLLALTHDGKEAWRRNLGPFLSEHSSGTSPIVFEDLVVLGNDQEGMSSLLAVDSKTGQTRWQIERRTAKASYATPTVVQLDDEPPQLLFTSTGHGFTSVDPKTGKVNWEIERVLPERCVASPLFASGLLFASSGTGGVAHQFVAVRPPSKKAGTPPQVVYTLKKAIPYVPTPIARDGLLFLWGDQGVVVCLRAATGEQLWQQRVGANFYGSPVLVGDRLYCVSRQGECFVLAASESFQLLGRNPLGEPSHATPAIAGGVMYLRTLSHLISVGGKR